MTTERPGRGPEGFDAFVTARYAAIVRVGALLSADPQLGEDLAQQALVAVLRAWPRLHPDGHPEAYARAVMVRLAARAGRRRWRGERPTEHLPEAAAPDPAERLPGHLDALALLADLPAAQRHVLVLRYWADLSEEQVATELGCSVGTVKSRTARALTRLRATAPEDDARRPGPAQPDRRRERRRDQQQHHHQQQDQQSGAAR